MFCHSHLERVTAERSLSCLCLGPGGERTLDESQGEVACGDDGPGHGAIRDVKIRPTGAAALCQSKEIGFRRARGGPRTR